MKKLTITLFLFFCFLTLNAQDYKFGKISKEELSEVFCPKDSIANAAVLYRSEDISFIFSQEEGFIQIRNVTERIKIYNKNGYDYATKKIYLYKGGTAKNEKVTNIKGTTFNLSGGKIENTKLKKDGIFEEEFNDLITITTLTMPNLKDGCVIEYSYKIVSPFLAIDDLVFQKKIPIKNLNVRLATPEYYRYNTVYNPKAFYTPRFKNSVETKKAYYKDRSVSFANRNKTTDNSFNYDENVIKVSEKDIPAVKTEAYSGGLNNYIGKMSLELSAIVDEYGSVEKSFSYSWGKVSNSIYQNEKFGNQLKRKNFFEKDIAPLLVNISSVSDKASILASYVKSKVRWNGIYGFTSQKGIKNAYNDGDGNVADINLLLISMLKSQGVNANPVLVSTKNNGIPLFPTRNGFNYVICVVEDQGKYFLIDATESYAPLNIVPLRAINWKGRLIKDDGTSEWISLRSKRPSVESTSLNIKINDDFSISGKVRQNITSNLALTYRKKYSNVSKDNHIKALENGKDGIEISELEFENSKDINKSVKISYKYNLEDAVDNIGGKLYIGPLLFMSMKENPFKLDTRQYPIDFNIPIKEKYVINIMLPNDYKVEALPKSEIIMFKDGEARYSYFVKENGKFLQFNISFELNNSLIAPVDYEIFKEFFERMIGKQAEQVVLTKV